ncbi:hypothetical protein GQ53DRAFT_46824 [Thozetella sp. PMI_491]|nr:hypothetical protein GQ53DRAFT_46824 [Thozetella sp. PMI_491]
MIHGMEFPASISSLYSKAARENPQPSASSSKGAMTGASKGRSSAATIAFSRLPRTRYWLQDRAQNQSVGAVIV